MTQTVDEFLAQFRYVPELLPVAPDLPNDIDVNIRAAGGGHLCLRCGGKANHPILAITDRPRWLDLCIACVHWLNAGTSHEILTTYDTDNPMPQIGELP